MTDISLEVETVSNLHYDELIEFLSNFEDETRDSEFWRSRLYLWWDQNPAFSDKIERTIFEEIQKFVEKYNKVPTQISLEIEVQDRKDLNETDYKKIIEVIKTLDSTEVDFDWLVDTTEKFCKDKAIYNAIVEGIQIIEGKDRDRDAGAIPSILTDALAVGFDNRVGHDYLLDADERFAFYHRVEEKIPFDLEFFNRITKG